MKNISKEMAVLKTSPSKQLRFIKGEVAGETSPTETRTAAVPVTEVGIAEICCNDITVTLKESSQDDVSHADSDVDNYPAVQNTAAQLDALKLTFLEIGNLVSEQNEAFEQQSFYFHSQLAAKDETIKNLTSRNLQLEQKIKEMEARIKTHQQV